MQKYNDMAEMPAQQLETMYPMTYYIIQPAVENTCDKMASAYGQMYTPSQNQIETMIDDIYNRVEPDVEAAVQDNPMDLERQFYGSRRRLLRDFIGALLISNLIRRRRPYFGYPNYYNYYNFPYLYY